MNPHAGLSLKRALAEHLDENVQSGKLRNAIMGQRIATSWSQLDPMLDPTNLSIQLHTLITAASAVGTKVDIRP